jgi:Flp pilus assembly protein TadG
MATTGPDRGQATVELALGLPLVMLVLLAVVQAGLVVRDQLAVVAAARAGARAGAVAADTTAAATRAATDAVAVRPLDVTVASTDEVIEVEVRYVSHTDVALIGELVPDVVVRATAAMALEPP